ncbi:MAG: substrate-binding domain-containing protein [Spirochaetaceae bacterium]|nr:substrate-binding domain-containing protein [Spirochaetaceae bacterium]
MKSRISIIFMIAAGLVLGTVPSAWSQNQRIKLATTTSTEQSGLLAWMLPVFEKQSGYKVDVIAVGTGASLKIAENGDCDIVLVHARSLEDAFMAAGYGSERRDVMYNDFIVLGPENDPAGIRNAGSAIEAFSRIAGKKAVFVSRGDNSGTHVKEKEVWQAAKIIPAGSWYKEAGQGMAQVILMAGQMGSYTLADRATWLAVKKQSPDLAILFEKDPVLLNPYGIITVSPEKWPSVNVAGAKALMDFFTGPTGKGLIESYKIGGEQCFFLSI